LNARTIARERQPSELMSVPPGVTELSKPAFTTITIQRPTGRSDQEVWRDAVTHQESIMAKPKDPREAAEESKKEPGGQQHQNPPRKTSTDNPERNPREQKGRGGSK
ncbi:MAG: hypothetical protein ABW003_18325, partial [Microvirga sp.]